MWDWATKTALSVALGHWHCQAPSAQRLDVKRVCMHARSGLHHPCTQLLHVTSTPRV